MATVTIQLQRMHPSQPWGFRLQGGQDFREELSVKKVTTCMHTWTTASVSLQWTNVCISQ